MTIHEAIKAVDGVKPGNVFSEREKISWLSTLDGIIKEEIMSTHEGHDSVIFDGYTDSTDPDTVLLVREPYSDIYLHYLSAMIDLYSGETDRYNNDMTLYNNAYRLYSDWYNRHYMPMGRKYIAW